MASSQKPEECDFSICLVGSLYKSYTVEDAETIYLHDRLPFYISYSVSRGNVKTVQDIQFSLNDYCRRELVSDFYLFYSKARELPEDCGIADKLNSFLTDAISEYFSGRQESTSAKFMFVNVILAELNLYCFKQKCYRFSKYLPILMDSVLKALVGQLFSKINTLKNENGELESDAVLAMYEDLRKYCRKIHVSDGEIIRNMIPPFLLKVKKLIMPDSPEGSSEELWERYEQSLQASGPIRQVQGRCALCKEANCEKYLQEFIDYFVEKFHRSCK